VIRIPFKKVKGKEIQGITVEKNTASALKQGARPLAIKKLNEKGVDTVLCPELCLGAKTMLDAFRIKTIRVESVIKVRDVLKNAL
jgi:predicted Fe-Mo cluster-binding NifX family protein